METLMHSYIAVFAALSCILISCSPSEESHSGRRYQKGEYIYRKHDEFQFQALSQEVQEREPYPWEKGQVGHQLKITKEFFRCKGSGLNPPHVIQEKGEMVRYYDCGGTDKHSLPLCNGKEFVYPILIDLLNYIQ